jgi:hypothetical protein
MPLEAVHIQQHGHAQACSPETKPGSESRKRVGVSEFIELLVYKR